MIYRFCYGVLNRQQFISLLEKTAKHLCKDSVEPDLLDNLSMVENFLRNNYGLRYYRRSRVVATGVKVQQLTPGNKYIIHISAEYAEIPEESLTALQLTIS